LRNKEAANDRQAERPPRFSARAQPSEIAARQERRHGRHHDGTEADQAAFNKSLGRALASRRSASSAKSICMMAFFFTMPTKH